MQQSTHKRFHHGQRQDTVCNLSAVTNLPAWLPDAVRLYIDHTEAGHSIRALARRDGMHASTVLRAVRRCELRRDDPLVDQALSAFHGAPHVAAPPLSEDKMHHTPIALPPMDDTALALAAPRLLRRLAETGAFLAIAPNMDKAAVMRMLPDGRLMRMAVVGRALAQVFALKEWIALREAAKNDHSKVDVYDLTLLGRGELKAQLSRGARGMHEAGASFSDEGGGAWDKSSDDGNRRVRYNLAESPVAVLGRRRDKDGTPYLAAEFVRAAERLREDFELAQMGTRVTQNWEGFLTGGVRGGPAGQAHAAPRDARARVAAALADLGPDLGHIALRVCCHLESVEEAEQRMGWAARSGKVVLRIALRRLWRHYEETYGRAGPLIG